jgi:hypothetical protein
LQINGTAMGTKMSPSYANIFMRRLERRFLYYSPTKPLSWLLFIDDIEMKWVDGRESLNDFIDMANFPQFHQIYCGHFNLQKYLSGYHSHTQEWGNPV